MRARKKLGRACSSLKSTRVLAGADFDCGSQSAKAHGGEPRVSRDWSLECLIMFTEIEQKLEPGLINASVRKL